MRQWREDSSVQNIKLAGRGRMVRPPANIERVRTAFTRSPVRFTNRLITCSGEYPREAFTQSFITNEIFEFE